MLKTEKIEKRRLAFDICTGTGRWIVASMSNFKMVQAQDWIDNLGNRARDILKGRFMERPLSQLEFVWDNTYDLINAAHVFSLLNTK